MQFLIDMNLSPRLADLLVNAGHQAIYWGTIGRPDAEDSEILDWAKNNDHVLLTKDLDFGTILATRGLKSPSVIQFRPAMFCRKRFSHSFFVLLKSFPPTCLQEH
jgi:predicted nuclease of predicted toxin-antitoxin system